jgi:hypothetical protein
MSDEPDTRGPAIIVEGSVLGGFEFMGPFESIDAAQQFWSRTWLHQHGVGCTIALLREPSHKYFPYAGEEVASPE